MPEPPVILVDATCALCSGLTRFVLNHERAPVARFAALQTETGRRIMQTHGLPVDALDTVVLVEGGQAYTRSDAAIRAARLLKAPWRWASVLRLMPRSIRDALYDLVARHRYRLFGKYDTCTLPSEAHRARFLDAHEY